METNQNIVDSVASSSAVCGHGAGKSGEETLTLTLGGEAIAISSSTDFYFTPEETRGVCYSSGSRK